MSVAASESQAGNRIAGARRSRRSGRVAKRRSSARASPWPHRTCDGRYTWVFNAPEDFRPDRRRQARRGRASAEAAARIARREARDAAQTGEPQQLELELAGDRGPRWFDVDGAPHYRAQGELVGTVFSAHRRHRPQGAGGAPAHRAARARAPVQEPPGGDPGDRAADGRERLIRRSNSSAASTAAIYLAVARP